jgi:hypothetical protein
MTQSQMYNAFSGDLKTDLRSATLFPLQAIHFDVKEAVLVTIQKPFRITMTIYSQK